MPKQTIATTPTNITLRLELRTEPICTDGTSRIMELSFPRTFAPKSESTWERKFQLQYLAWFDFVCESSLFQSALYT